MRMHRRPATANVLVNVLVLVLLVWGLTAAAAMPAHAARRAPAAVAIVTVTETAKVTLPETSIAGPSLHVNLAWTGTDAAHHLNVLAGNGGLSFSLKTILPETSPNGPGMTIGPGEFPLSSTVAWRGSDRNHSLNLEFDTPGHSPSGKQTLHETTIATPAVAFADVSGKLGTLLAWTGTDANHSLNLLPIFDTGPGTKIVLSQFSSDAGPSLLGNVDSSEFVLGWTARGTQRLNFATSDDGVDFTRPLAGGLPQTSATAPQFIQPTSTSFCMAWTGTDAAHHLNVQCTTQFPQFPDPANTKTVLPETALGAPGFFVGEIAWTGTDAAHHLNVATLQGL
jgi:hypothetical protein